MLKGVTNSTIAVFLVMTLCATAIIAILLLVLFGPDGRDIMPVITIIIAFVGTVIPAVFTYLKVQESAERTHAALHEAREIKAIVKNGLPKESLAS